MQKPASDPAYAISMWRAEFSDPATEQAYRRHIADETARHLRISLVVWASLLLLFALPDLEDMGPTPGFYLLLGLRVVQAALLFALAWWVVRRPSWATNGWPVTILMITGFPMFFVIFHLRPDIVVLNISVIMFLLITMFVVIPGRVVLTTLAALVGILGTLLSLAIHPDPEVDLQLATLLPVLVMPTLTGFVAAHRLQLSRRHAFTLLVELQRQANTDPLTGLLNRRQYEDLYRRERERCRRMQTPLMVGIVDLDHFKRINDSLGHDCGDQVLKHVAKVLQSPLRQTDVLGRFGGEEFILLLPDTAPEEAAQVVERLRRALEQTPFLHNGDRLKLTATFAITEVQAADEGIEDAIRRVDEALYRGKRAGRNRVEVA